MPFRRDNSRHHAWKKWVADQRDHLLAAGVPDWILTDELRWLRFLEEGSDHVTWLPVLHARRCSPQPRLGRIDGSGLAGVGEDGGKPPDR